MNKVEEPDASSPGAESRVHTPAYASFDSNTDKLKHVLTFITRGVQHFSDELKTTQVVSEIANLSRPPRQGASEPQTEKEAHYSDQVKRILDNFVETVQGFTGGLLEIRQWIPVMLVTMVEAYLKEVLIYAAKVDPAIMESSKQSASSANVMRAQSLDELEELKEELRSRWARNFVDDGGPDRWIKKLSKMGARQYRSHAADEMETLWGIRHRIVHSAGVATPDFVRRHPEIRAKAGEIILIRSYQLSAWINVVYHFVDVTDFYFVQRYGLETGSTT